MKEFLPGYVFRAMSLVMRIGEWIYPFARKRTQTFPIKPGMTVVDYACGPGRYTMEFAKRVGHEGKVVAVDIQALGLQAIEKKAESQGIKNIKTQLAKGYDSALEPEMADIVFALDVFFMIENPTEFLRELRRICKNDGILILDDGHQSRAATKRKLAESNAWRIAEETRGFLKCVKL